MRASAIFFRPIKVRRYGRGRLFELRSRIISACHALVELPILPAGHLRLNHGFIKLHIVHRGEVCCSRPWKDRSQRSQRGVLAED